MTNIILCGGSGTRLWPISRTLMPKQFLKLFDDKSLFQLTVERNSKVCDSQLIVSNTEQYFLALDQLEEMTKEENTKYLLEPIGRNTAPAIALACMSLPKDELVLVTPSDHLVKDEIEYKRVIQKAKELAENNSLVTFGINPTFAETGFGYIQAKPKNDECLIMNVECFKEKPSLELAEQYLEENSKLSIQNLPLKFLWNSGMFCFKAGVFLDELKKYSPKIYDTCKVAFEYKKTENSIYRIQHSMMEDIPSDSIDYAVMEKSSIVKVVASNIGWSDVGSFDSLADELENDKNNNLILSNKTVELIDIKDSIVVDTDDALLICKKDSSQKVKDIVANLKTQNSRLVTEHSLVHRPWGTYEVLLSQDSYKLKRLIVKPNKKLSLQKHFHRNEHWIVISGSATVTIEDKQFQLNPNQSTYINAGQLHRLENNGQLPLVVIEAQVGEYTGEDDIIRIEDDFKRDNTNKIQKDT